MANSGVHGRVLDQTGAGVSGVLVAVYDVGGILPERLLRNTATDSGFPTHLDFPDYGLTIADGSFKLTYEEGLHDLFIRLYASDKRQIGATPLPYLHVGDTMFELPAPIMVAQGGEPGLSVGNGYSTTLIAGNTVEWLVDNEVAWKRIFDSVSNAKKTVDWMLFYLDVRKVLLEFNSPIPEYPSTQVVSGASLEEKLSGLDFAKVKVRLLCNQLVRGKSKIRLPYPTNTAKEVQDYFAGHANVEVRPFKTPAYTPIHTKFVVVDNNEAFIIGSPFVHDYYDDHRHRISDARHGFFFDFLCSSAAIRVPTHDVSLFLKGPVIGGLNDTFALHWNAAQPGVPQVPPPAPPPAENVANAVSVQVTRSLTGNGVFSSLPRGETTILESYLRAIFEAQTYIYLENQYFTCDQIAEALVIALKKKPSLEVIFLTNNAVDIPGYSIWQPQTISKVLDILSETERDRIGFFSIWSHEAPATGPGDDPRPQICRNYIHSKVGIVDDSWATVGSANLDGDSLLTSDNAIRSGLAGAFTGSLFHLRADGVVAENRESETNIVVYGGPVAGTAAQAGHDCVSGLRRRLWAEHLGFTNTNGQPDENAPELQASPDGTWLKLWTRLAKERVASLVADPTVTSKKQRVLPFPKRITSSIAEPEQYLKDLTIDPEKLYVWKHFRRFSWDSGKWED